jgi:hypothetical protein
LEGENSIPHLILCSSVEVPRDDIPLPVDFFIFFEEKSVFAACPLFVIEIWVGIVVPSFAALARGPSNQRRSKSLTSLMPRARPVAIRMLSSYGSNLVFGT